jgi:glycosyltransferase EpsE
MQEKLENKAPMISVIMGVYNCENTVSDAINSVLNQTYQNFEFIICDDGSTDTTLGIAEKYAHDYSDKIILIRNDRNRGLNYTLNHCLKYAKGKYIARMDGDDKSLPVRFEKEVEFLENHSEISILGASLKAFDDKGIWGTHTFKEYPVAKDFLHGSPFSHSVCMVRREAYMAVDGYSEGKFLMRVEDYHLWTKMYSKGYKGANLQEELYLYRDDRDGYQKRKFRYRLNEAYVSLIAVKMLHLPIWSCLYAIRPIVVGLLPSHIYEFLHKRKLKQGNEGI